MKHLTLQILQKECETIYAKNEDEKRKSEPLELWKKIALEELKEYIYHLFESAIQF